MLCVPNSPVWPQDMPPLGNTANGSSLTLPLCALVDKPKCRLTNILSCNVTSMTSLQGHATLSLTVLSTSLWITLQPSALTMVELLEHSLKCAELRCKKSLCWQTYSLLINLIMRERRDEVIVHRGHIQQCPHRQGLLVSCRDSIVHIMCLSGRSNPNGTASIY